MRQSSARAGAVLGAFLLFGFIILGAQPVAADDAVRGVVLAVQRSTDRIVVRPDDGATVSVRAEPASVVATLAVGARVSGRLDRSTTPPTLRELRLVGTAPVVDPTHVDQAFVSAQQLIHSVKLLAVGDRLPATRFVDQRGRSFSFDRLRGQGVVIGFIYTRCKDINECPLVTAHFHVLQEQFKNQPVHLVELTIDPAHDTPAVLAAYGNAYGEDPRRWTFLTGDPNTVLRFGARLGVTAIPDPRVGLIHTERTVLVGPDGTVRMLIDEADWAPNDIVAEMRTVMAGNGNPFERFNLWLSAQAVSICGGSVRGVPGVVDLGIVIAVLGTLGWVLYRVARGILSATT